MHRDHTSSQGADCVLGKHIGVVTYSVLSTPDVLLRVFMGHHKVPACFLVQFKSYYKIFAQTHACVVFVMLKTAFIKLDSQETDSVSRWL